VVKIVVKDHFNNSYAFITFKSSDEATKVKNVLQGSLIFGDQPLKIGYAAEHKEVVHNATNNNNNTGAMNPKSPKSVSSSTTASPRSPVVKAAQGKKSNHSSLASGGDGATGGGGGGGNLKNATNLEKVSAEMLQVEMEKATNKSTTSKSRHANKKKTQNGSVSPVSPLRSG
jgi:hypothetical protein